MACAIACLRDIARIGLAVMSLASGTAATAQASPSPYTSATRYDALGRMVGTISPDPDGVGSGNPFLATRTTFDGRGLPTKVENGTLSSWQSEAVQPANWAWSWASISTSSLFTVYGAVETTYDTIGRKLTETVKGSDGIAASLTQFSYDNAGRLECTAVRMNPAAYASLPPSACTQGAAGSYGPDRITRNIYDAADQLLQVRVGVGSAVEAADVTYSYTINGRKQYVVDAEGNRAEYVYDGHDRLQRWYFPSTTRPAAYNDSTPAGALASAGSINSGDYEEYGYDANGNRTSLRKRDGSVLSYSYDALNRMTVKVVPERAGLSTTHTRDVHYGYDLRGLMTYARFDSGSGEGVTIAYDGFGHKISETFGMDGVSRAIGSAHDANGNRTSVTYPDAVSVAYSYDGLGRNTGVTDWAVVSLSWTNYNARGLADNRSYSWGAMG